MSLLKRNKVKYIVLAAFVLLYFMSDAIYHIGQIRVMIPHTFLNEDTFSEKPPDSNRVINPDQKWKKAINSPADLARVSGRDGGLEVDVYFDTLAKSFRVHHDPNDGSPFMLSDLLDRYQEKHFRGSIWLDFKNLSVWNKKPALEELMRLRDKYHLRNKLLVESQLPDLLNDFSRNDFFTIYYTPYFNPYFLSRDSLRRIQNRISKNLSRNNIHALSGYYFQYPFLHERFPDYPILVWGRDDSWSLVSFAFSRYIKNRDEVFIYLTY